MPKLTLHSMTPGTDLIASSTAEAQAAQLMPCSLTVRLSINEGRRKKEEGRRKREEGRRKKEEGRNDYQYQLPITNYQLSTVNCQLSTVNCQLFK
ncbi:MAG: hypothetical protein HC786_28565 [Richelia sp. CSU_2_1]|nr:hypothetical protein [Richelia sp. CSU_2_1]